MLTLPSIAQIALCTSDLPRSIALFKRAFGFADARGEAVCGHHLAEIQALGNDASTLVWWLPGARPFTQLELFQHIDPPQRPLPATWRPSDPGWVRWGMHVADLDACLEGLRRGGISPITEPAVVDGRERFCFRDPWVGNVVEVISQPAPDPENAGPALAYAALSVSDLDAARRFWLTDLGLPEDSGFRIDDDRQTLWGLTGATADAFAVRLNDIRIEIISYHDRSGATRSGRLLSDQGMMNIGLGFREREPLERLVARLIERGHETTVPLGPGLPAATYAWGPENISIELLCVPEHQDALVGFLPRNDSPLFG